MAELFGILRLALPHVMLSPKDIAKLKAEIERLERAGKACTDTRIQNRIEALIEELKQKLASGKTSKWPTVPRLLR